VKSDRITQRLYVLGTLTTTSPLIIGSGEDDFADIQMMRGWDGLPFIPGSALAGATRHFLSELLPSQQSVIDLLYGAKADLADAEKDTTQSLITFYDLFPIGDVNLSSRDGVRLDYETKTAIDQAKYDYEIVERGQQFIFKLEVVFRANHEKQQAQMRDVVTTLCSAIMGQHVTLGAKTRRGFGEVCLQEAAMLTLNMPDDAQTWIDFEWRQDYFAAHHAAMIVPQAISNPRHTDISVTFDIPYSILIRHENGNPSAPDVSHLTSQGIAIIPGTSWGGALRHAVHTILHDMGQGAKSEAIITEIFGEVDQQVRKNKQTTPKARASRITIREALIEGGQSLSYTRNKVDRFTGGVVDTALFDEQPHYGGKVTLSISIKHAQEWEKGVLLLALKDLGNGIQPVGGGANIGRGILQNAAITLENAAVTPENESACLQALARKLKEAL